MKKPVLNLTLTLTLMLGLPAEHSDVFHCLYKGELGLEQAKRASRLTKNLPLYNYVVCLIFK